MFMELCRAILIKSAVAVCPPMLVPVANTSLVTICSVTVKGPGEDDGTRIERGGRMLNI
jgi:hypothetical protein